MGQSSGQRGLEQWPDHSMRLTRACIIWLCNVEISGQERRNPPSQMSML